MVLFACAKAGLVLVPLSWRLSPRELAEQVGRQPTRPLLLVEEEFTALARATLDLVIAPVPVTADGRPGRRAARAGPRRVGVPAASGARRRGPARRCATTTRC